MRRLFCSVVVVAVLATAATLAMAAKPGHHTPATASHHVTHPHIAGIITAVRYAPKTKRVTSFVIRTWGKKHKTVTVNVSPKTRFVMVEPKSSTSKKPKVVRVHSSSLKVGLFAFEYFGTKDTHMTGPALAVRLRKPSHNWAHHTAQAGHKAHH